MALESTITCRGDIPGIEAILHARGWFNFKKDGIHYFENAQVDKKGRYEVCVLCAKNREVKR